MLIEEKIRENKNFSASLNEQIYRNLMRCIDFDRDVIEMEYVVSILIKAESLFFLGGNLYYKVKHITMASS